MFYYAFFIRKFSIEIVSQIRKNKFGGKALFKANEIMNGGSFVLLDISCLVFRDGCSGLKFVPTK